MRLLPSMPLAAGQLKSVATAVTDAAQGSTTFTTLARLVRVIFRMRNLATSSVFLLTLVFAPSLVIRVPLAALWFSFSALLAAVQGVYVVYQLVMIFLSLGLLSSLLFLRRMWARMVRLTWGTPRWQRVQTALAKAGSWEEYKALAVKHGQGADEWLENEDDMPTAALLHRAISDLREASELKNEKLQQLRFALSGLTKRNHLSIESSEWYPPLSPVETKAVIDEYLGEVTKCLYEVADSPEVEDEDKLRFFHQVRRSVGVTALCLSGGGATTMYHGGHILGLIESGVFDSIKVVSGTSGGSIMAAMMGCKNKAELLDQVLVSTVSTDYGRDGRQKKEQLHFFPPLWQQMLYFVKSRVLVDSSMFKKTCEYYWGEITFQEAFEHTQKVLCISVSAQRTAAGGDKSQRLLMNHITTPHVTLASAVAASCALPGIQRPQSLEAKDAQGRIVPFEVDGVAWIDGSIQADVPFKRMSTLFNVSNFIVAQVNFHVKLVVEDSSSPYTPYGHDAAPTCGSVPPRLWAAYRRLVRGAELSLRMRATMLSQLGLMPSLYGNNLQKVFSQRYHGDVTISPRFTYMQAIGLSAICNPGENDMRRYIQGGKRAVWPHVNRIRHMLTLEDALSACWQKVRASANNTRDRGGGTSKRHFGSVPHNLRNFFELSDHELDIADCSEPNDKKTPTDNDSSKEDGAPASSPDEAIARRYRRLEWEYRRVRTQMERLRSDNLDLRRRLDNIAAMCTS